MNLLSNMNRNILNQAFITMGYRKMAENVYGKPIGFCIIIAEIDSKLTFKTIFNKFSNPEEKLVYSSYTIEIDDKDKLSNEDIYEMYCNEIAYAEIEVNVGKAMEAGRKNSTFAFQTQTDMMSMINL